jgi:hypothetical protein
VEGGEGGGLCFDGEFNGFPSDGGGSPLGSYITTEQKHPPRQVLTFQ